MKAIRTVYRPVGEGFAWFIAGLLWFVVAVAVLVARIIALFAGGLAWAVFAYARLRHGREAAAELRGSSVQWEAEGAAWSERMTARLARRVGWPSDD